MCDGQMTHMWLQESVLRAVPHVDPDGDEQADITMTDATTPAVSMGRQSLILSPPMCVAGAPRDTPDAAGEFSRVRTV